MRGRFSFLVIGLGLLTAIACTGGGEDDTGGNAGSGPVAGFYGGEAGRTAGTAGNIAAGAGGSVNAGVGGIGGSTAAGTGGVAAGTGGVAAGTGNIEAGTGGAQAGTGGVLAGTGGAQAGAGGVAAGTGGSDGGAGDDAYLPPCLQAPSQVVFFGDSYMTMYPDTTVSPIVAALAQADGALGAGDAYRDYSFPGTSMGTGEIPGQATLAIQENPDIILVVMTGGGNDVLIGARQCLEPGSSSDPGCQAVIQNAIDTASGMFDDAVAAGVSDVIYFFYPHIPPAALLTGTAPNEILDYAYPLTQEQCEGAEARYDGAIRCYFIDLRPIFGDTYQYVNPLEGIHPTPEGAQLIANEIYRVMKDNCLGQPASTGCCVP